MKTLEDRISALEAENRELRKLWIETEGAVIELRTYLDKQLDGKKDKDDVKGLAALIMRVHRMNGGVIRERSK